MELLFDPFDLTGIEVRYEGRPMGRAVPRRITRHVHPKARPEAAPPPKPSGIDYLGLVAARWSEHEARRTGRRINYSGITDPDTDNSGDVDGAPDSDDDADKEEER